MTMMMMMMDDDDDDPEAEGAQVVSVTCLVAPRPLLYCPIASDRCPIVAIHDHIDSGLCDNYVTIDSGLSDHYRLSHSCHIW